MSGTGRPSNSTKIKMQKRRQPGCHQQSAMTTVVRWLEKAASRTAPKSAGARPSRRTVKPKKSTAAVRRMMRAPRYWSDRRRRRRAAIPSTAIATPRMTSSAAEHEREVARPHPEGGPEVVAPGGDGEGEPERDEDRAGDQILQRPRHTGRPPAPGADRGGRRPAAPPRRDAIAAARRPPRRPSSRDRSATAGARDAPRASRDRPRPESCRARRTARPPSGP